MSIEQNTDALVKERDRLSEEMERLKKQKSEIEKNIRELEYIYNTYGMVQFMEGGGFRSRFRLKVKKENHSTWNKEEKWVVLCITPCKENMYQYITQLIRSLEIIRNKLSPDEEDEEIELLDDEILFEDDSDEVEFLDEDDIIFEEDEA